MILKKNPEELIGKEYHPDKFNCYTFVNECLNIPSIQDIANMSPEDAINDNKPFYIKLDEPIDNCIVLLGREHLGLFKDGYVYHADKDMVKAQTLRVLSKIYSTITYYDKDTE